MGNLECPKCSSVICSVAEMAYHVKVCLNGLTENFCADCGRGYSSKVRNVEYVFNLSAMNARSSDINYCSRTYPSRGVLAEDMF